MTVLPISVCIPVKNEAKNLPNCLRSLNNAFDDVVVVDSGSTDATVSIAKQAGAKVLDFRWDGGFPKKRNWALQNHEFRHPWVLFLDADECLTPDVIKELRAKVPGSTHAGYWISFTNWFMGRPLRHGDMFRKLALFRKDAGQYERFPESWWSHLDMEVHEHPILTGTTGVIESRLEHRDYRGLAQYIGRHNEYSTWEANRWHWLSSAGATAWQSLTSRQQFKYRNLHRWWFAKFYWFVSYVLKRGFLDGRQGLIFASYKHRYFVDIRLKILELHLNRQQSC